MHREAPYQLGAIVLYKPRDNEDGYPAIVMKEWGDQTYQLYVLHFEGNQMVRAANHHQIKCLLDPAHIVELMVNYDEHDKRLATLESKLEQLLVIAPHGDSPSEEKPKNYGNQKRS